MFNYIIKPMETADEIDGKGYVHYKSWQEAYRPPDSRSHSSTSGQ